MSIYVPPRPSPSQVAVSEHSCGFASFPLHEDVIAFIGLHARVGWEAVDRGAGSPVLLQLGLKQKGSAGRGLGPARNGKKAASGSTSQVRTLVVGGCGWWLVVGSWWLVVGGWRF